MHVIASDVWRELSRLNIPCGMAAKALVDAGKEIPTKLMLELLKEKLSMGECVSHGWILEGFPTDAASARKLLSAGLLPTRFLHINLSDADVALRTDAELQAFFNTGTTPRWRRGALQHREARRLP